MQSPREKCLAEIAAIELEIFAGNKELAGLLLALRDWNEELRIVDAGTNSSTNSTETSTGEPREASAQ
jgi:hypothetical protein